MGDGSRGDWYFAGSQVEGAGPLFFLKLPKRAQPGDDALELIGSFVNRVNYGGLLGAFDKECPEPSSEYENMAALNTLAEIAGKSPEDLYSEDVLAGAVSSFKGLKKFGISGEANFPGAPKGKFSVDYKKIRTIDISFGEGSILRDLRTGYLKDGLRKIRANPGNYSGGFFDDDMMIVDKILIARNLEITVNMRSSFDAGVKAELAAETLANSGLSYSSHQNKTIVLSMSDDVPYLFGVSGLRHTALRV